MLENKPMQIYLLPPVREEDMLETYGFQVKENKRHTSVKFKQKLNRFNSLGNIPSISRVGSQVEAMAASISGSPSRHSIKSDSIAKKQLKTIKVGNVKKNLFIEEPIFASSQMSESVVSESVAHQNKTIEDANSPIWL